MCGGRSTRLRGGDDEGGVGDDHTPEKPLAEVGGASMLSRAVDALRASDVNAVHGVVSPHAPDTADRARALSLPTIGTLGEGYVADLRTVLAAVGEPAATTPWR